MKFFIAVPSYDGSMRTDTAHSINVASKEHPGEVQWADCHSSLLGITFNRLLTRALYSGAQYFCMLHADVAPDPYWIDTLLGEMKASKADVISAVIPLKGVHGLTSTAVDLGSEENPWRCRRITMKEVFGLPETFTAADFGYKDKALLINTGCMMFDLFAPWVKSFPGFTVSDKASPVDCQFCNAKGCAECGNHGWRMAVQVESEDWGFGRWLHKNGLKAVATRKVLIRHFGSAFYTNSVPWGTFDRDPEIIPEKELKEPVPFSSKDELYLL